MYDLAIIGGGPAGVAGGVYASRKQLKTVFITQDFGGQSVVSLGIENWIGTIKLTGFEYAGILKKHLEAYAGDSVEIREGKTAERIDKKAEGFEIKTDAKTHRSKTLLISTGSHRRKLTVPGADRFENKGITYCASCDGPLFAGKDVVVVGGGNAGFETAAQLLAYCPKVILIHRSDNFRADPVTVEKVLSNPNMKAIKNADILEIKGGQFPERLIYKDKLSGTVSEVPAEGVFVEIGAVPTTEFAAHLLKLNQYNQIVVDPKNQRTSIAGIWAAGDCTDGLYHQNNIAAGDAVKALEDIYLYLHAK